MFIDIHAHAYWEPVPYVANFATPEQLIEIYDKYGIEKGVLLPVVNCEVYFPQSNEDILNMAAKYPDRFIPYCNIDPRAMSNSPEAPLDKILQYYKDKGCKGIGEIMPNLEVMDPLVQNLFRCAEKVGLPVVFDGSDQKRGDFGLYDDPGLPQLEHTLQRYPNLKVFGHGPVFWTEIARLETPAERAYIMNPDVSQVGRLPDGPIKEEGVVPKLFRRYKNLYGDLSDGTCYRALTRDEEYGPKFLEEFKDRLYFGTDYCSVGMELPLCAKLIEWRDKGKIGNDTFNKIARENAIKLFDL